MTKGKTPILTKFVKDKTSFVSKGFVDLKLTTIKGEDEEEVKIFRIPIKSIGMSEFQTEMEKMAPLPPSELVEVKKGSVYESNFGLEVGTITKVFNATDPEYREEYKKFEDNFWWQITIQALDMEFEDSEGNPLETLEEKRDALIAAGITPSHVLAIINAVSRLSGDSESMADFLSGKKLGSATR